MYILSIPAQIGERGRAPGCVPDLRVPEANLDAARQAVEDLHPS
jgi:hypothetical protein